MFYGIFLQILDINLSILRWFVAFFVNFGHENVVFALVRGIFAELRTVVRTACGQFCGIFAELRTVVRTVCGQFCGRSFALGVSFVQTQSVNATVARGVYTAVLRVSIAGEHSQFWFSSHSFAKRQHTCGHSVNLTQLVFPVWSGTLIVLSDCLLVFLFFSKFPVISIIFLFFVFFQNFPAIFHHHLQFSAFSSVFWPK